MRSENSPQPAGVISDAQARKTGRPVGNAGLFSNDSNLSQFYQMLLRGGSAEQTRVLVAKVHAWLMHPCSPPEFPGPDCRYPNCSYTKTDRTAGYAVTQLLQIIIFYYGVIYETKNFVFFFLPGYFIPLCRLFIFG